VLSQVAMGQEPAQLVIRNAVLFNPFTREFLSDHAIWVAGGKVAYSGPDTEPPVDATTQVIQADGMVLLPGLVESHTHIVNRCGVEEFIRYTLPGGVTTAVTETIELATVVGKPGIAALVEALRDQPLRFFYTVPALCGLTQEEEMRAPQPEEMIPFLDDPACVGLGEIYWGNLLLEGPQGRRLKRLVQLALERGKRVEGHTAGARGHKLQAYTSWGISSCHEPISAQEVLERLRLGYWVMIREGSIRRELEGVGELFGQNLDLRRLALCTDSVDPEDFLSEGSLDGSVRRALKTGLEPGLVYQMVTLNPAEHFGLETQVGSLAHGRWADWVIIPSPRDYRPVMVGVAGRPVYQEGRLLAEPRRVEFPQEFQLSVNPPSGPIRLPDLRGRVRVMELITRLVTRELIVDLQEPGARDDLLWIMAADRLGGGGVFVGLLKGFGLSMGACGSTMCWDTGDLLAVGCDEASMQTVVGRLKELGGGAVYAVGSQVVAEYPAPICGMVSQETMPVLRARIRKIEDAMARAGVSWDKSLLTIDTLATAAIPHLRITHRGYVRLKDRALLGLDE
jgi:adenine deaminase